MLKKLPFFLLVVALLVGLVNLPTASAQGMAGETISLAGLDGEVTVKYDGFNIPHVYATTTHDLLMVQGYLTAQNRWWQMEWSRRQAWGRLSEVMGDSLIGTDTFLRTIGLGRTAALDLAAVSPETTSGLQAYAEGVNAFLEGKAPAEAALEYRFLSWMGAELPLEPWTPIDTLAFGQAMAFSLERGNLEDELLKEVLIEDGGPLAPFLLMPEYDYENDPLISEPGWQPPTARPALNVAGLEPIHLSEPIDVVLPFPQMIDAGSNSWVVSGAHTDTGMPYLANDPHLGQGDPSVWIEMGLHCVEVNDACPIDAYGYSLPGIPAFVIGHNRHIAWGMTVNGIDTIDLYTLELNPENPLQYMYNGAWTDMEVITETINVARAEPVQVEIHMTHYGPVVNHLVGVDQPMAMRSVAAEPSQGIETFLMLGQASNMEEFQAAIARFDLAGQNFAYADGDGNIGVVAGGKIPLRVAGHDGSVPVSGADDSFAWQGFVDPMENPRIFNPESGYVVAANNAFVRPENFPTTFGVYFNYGQRAARIETLLQGADVVSMDTMIAIQNDNYNPAAGIVMPVLSQIDFGDETLNAARDWLAEWDMMNDADSGQAALFNAFWMKLIPLAFDEVINNAPDISGGSREMILMRNMIQGEHPLWNNRELGTNNRDEILGMALGQAWQMMVETFGEDTSTWRWGALHISHPKHSPLGQIPMGVDPKLDILAFQFADIFNRQYEVDGGLESVNNQRWDIRNGHFELDGAIVSMRMVIDFSNLDNSRFVHELGQSGDPFSPHFDDLSPLWVAGEYHPYGFTPAGVDAITQHTVTFVPAE